MRLKLASMQMYGWQPLSLVRVILLPRIQAYQAVHFTPAVRNDCEAARGLGQDLFVCYSASDSCVRAPCGGPPGG